MQEYSSYRVTCVLAISQLRTAKHLSIVWRDKAKWQKTLKVKIRARNYKRCLITSMHVCARARVCACVCWDLRIGSRQRFNVEKCVKCRKCRKCGQ